ncbi:MAG: hypothetical protein SGJ05_03295 [bacterium]|nr:hypothetical protein [bacterium]
MTFLRTIALAGLAVLAIYGCTPKGETNPIESLKVYVDSTRRFEIKLPANWERERVPGVRVSAISTTGISRRFQDFGKGDGGAKVDLQVVPLDSTMTMDTLIERVKLEFADGLSNRYNRTQTTLGGKPATKLAVKFDQEDGEYESETYFAENDSVATVVQFAAFGKTYADYKNEFAEILSSVKLAQRPVVVVRKVDSAAPSGPVPPSTTLRTYSAPEFTIQIPENFEGKKGSSSGLSSVSFFGSRLDCIIQVDVFDASKQKDLDKIVAQNKGNYGGNKVTATKLGGEKSYYFSYNPNSKISSRAYFTVKGNRMYRVTVNWFKEEQNLYLPLFEKCLGTLQLK